MSDQEIESKLKKLEQMMNDDGASEGEKSNALLLFEKLVKNYNVDISKRKESSIFEYKSTIAFTPEAFNGVYHSIATYYAKYFNIYCICSLNNSISNPLICGYLECFRSRT